VRERVDGKAHNIGQIRELQRAAVHPLLGGRLDALQLLRREQDLVAQPPPRVALGGDVLPLDAKTGLLTGLLAGKQGWKCPVALLMTCCGSKSLKVILIDSDFRACPVLNPLVTL
jgi:hypothetical protein